MLLRIWRDAPSLCSGLDGGVGGVRELSSRDVALSLIAVVVCLYGMGQTGGAVHSMLAASLLV